MKKIIKLLFPKTYQAILNEGYDYCYNHIYGPPNYDHYYDYDYQDDYPEVYHDEQDELARLHDEHYADLIEEYEEECRQEEKALAEIYLPKAPVLQAGDRIHLHSKQGMYTVTDVYTDSFAYRTRSDQQNCYADYSDYKCHAGGRWNHKRE